MAETIKEELQEIELKIKELEKQKQFLQQFTTTDSVTEPYDYDPWMGPGNGEYI